MSQTVNAEELIGSGVFDWPRSPSGVPASTDLSYERYCAHLVIKVLGQPPAHGAAVLRVTERASWLYLGGYGTTQDISLSKDDDTASQNAEYFDALPKGYLHTPLESSPGVSRHLVGIESPYLGVLVLDAAEAITLTSGALALLRHSTEFFAGGVPSGRHSAHTARPGAEGDTFFTPRQHEVLQLVAEGKSNTEIGRKLSISASLAKLEVTFLMHALGAKNRLDAVVQAQRNGILPIPSAHGGGEPAL